MAVTSQALQAAVHKATTPNWDAAPEDQEGDPIAMVEISEAIASNPKLLPDLVKFIKARIKDQNTQVTFIALDVMDQSMESYGFTFQTLVQKKALERIGKISAGPKGVPEMVRSKAAALITRWGDLYGSDPRLEGFKKAALVVKSKEVKDVREAFSEELKELKELKEAQRVANEADAEEVKAAMKEMGIEPKEPAQAAQAPPKKKGFFSSFSNKEDKKKAAERAAQLKKEEQEAKNQMTYMVMMGKAKEASEMLGAVIEGSSAEDLQANEAAQEVVMTCMKYQSHLEVLASSVQEDEQVAACIALNEELTERINLYQQFVSGEVQPGDLLSVPIPRIGSGAAAMRTAPVVEESTSTLSDASSIFKGQVTMAGLPPPDYSESDEDDDGTDLINFGDASVASGGAAAAGGSPGVNFGGNDPPKVNDSTENALKDVFGGSPAAMGRETSNLGGGGAAPSNPFDTPTPAPLPPAAAAGGGGGGGGSVVGLYYASSGVLYKDSNVKVEMSDSYQGTQGTLSLSLVNVGGAELSEIGAEVSGCDGLSASITPPATNCAPGASVAFSVTVEASAPNADTASMQLSYSAGGDTTNTSITLPSVVTKFFSAMEIDKAAFDDKFDACGMSLGDVINTSSRWATPDVVRDALSGLNMALVDAGDPATVIGSATYPGPAGPVDCFVKLEGVSDSTFLMDVRSGDDSLKNTLEKVVKKVLESS